MSKPSGRQIEIEWPELGITITANLRDDMAPGVCDVVWNSLPISTVHEHGMISGKVIYCATRIRSTLREWMVERGPGDLYFFNVGQMIIMVHGYTTEHLKVNKFAEVIPEDLEKLNIAGDKIWNANYLTHEVLHVNFRQKV